ncbi:MAG: hypothetical protein SFU56_16105 [Capsulimonadales bacterium]|nr:hypothetical protein [Capsulimonadales bacterium]
MAVSELFACDRCEFDAVLIHALEWQPIPGGGREPYPGYGLIGGLANRLWCRGCRAPRDFAFVVLDPPADHAVVAYAEAQRLGCTGTEVGPCPVCGTVLTWNAENEPCPKCENGVLRFLGEWEDAV